MSYNQNIPQSTDQLSQSQADLLNNFAAIYSLIGINHVNFNVANQGKHNFVSMPVQLADPGTLATELALYTKTSTLSSNPECFIQRQSNGIAIEFTSATQASNGWSRLPSNILIKWGSSSGTGSTLVTLPTAASIPVFSNVFQVLVVPYVNGAIADPNVSATLIGFTTTTITVWTAPRITIGSTAVTFNYLIIGN